MNEVDRFYEWLRENKDKYTCIGDAARSFRYYDKVCRISDHRGTSAVDPEYFEDYYGSDHTTTTLDGFKVNVIS